MKSVQAGRLKHKAEIQRQTVTTDAAGHSAVSGWAKIATVRVSLAGQTSREAGNGAPSTITHRIGMHYRDGVRGSDRLVLSQGSRVFKFAAPPSDPDGDRRFLIADAIEEVTP